MFKDPSAYKKIYLACGHTDLRFGIDGLAQQVECVCSNLKNSIVLSMVCPYILRSAPPLQELSDEGVENMEI